MLCLNDSSHLVVLEIVGWEGSSSPEYLIIRCRPPSLEVHKLGSLSHMGTDSF